MFKLLLQERFSDKTKHAIKAQSEDLSVTQKLAFSSKYNILEIRTHRGYT